MMAGALAAARPDLVGRIALLSSTYPLPEGLLALGGLAGTPVFAGTGDADPFHPLEVHRAGVASYRGAGAEVTERVYPGAGHEITAAEVEDLRAWLGGGEG
jgi:predicted esterase